MTTLAHALTHGRLKELDALTRVRRAIVANCTIDASVWAYCVAALDARLSVLRELLAHEDPHVLRTCEAELTHERQTAALVSSVADLKVGHRLH